MQQCEEQLGQLAAERLRSEALSEALKQEQSRATALTNERDAFQGEVSVRFGHVLSFLITVKRKFCIVS